jgi:hypothetical protein
MMQVASQVTDPGERSRVMVQILRQRKTAHGTARGQPSVSRVQTTTAIVVLQEREVRRNLASQIALAVVATDDVQQSTQKATHSINSLKVQSLKVTL